MRQALRLAPAVRGIHFQPVSYFGRFPEQKVDKDRFTLPDTQIIHLPFSIPFPGIEGKYRG